MSSVNIDLAEVPFGIRVMMLRQAANLTQAELADRMGTTKATVSKIERATLKPTVAWGEKIADALGVSRMLVMVGAKSEARPMDPIDQVELIPVIGMIAAGNWREAIEHPDDFVPVAGANPHMFALRIDGDSIDRVAPHGSYVTIDPTMPSLKDGGMYAIQNGDGEATIKRFRSNPDRLEPDSTNPIHKPIMLGSEVITVIGRATSVTRTL